MGKSSDFFSIPDGAEFPQGDKLLRYTRRINDLELRCHYIFSCYDTELQLLLSTFILMPDCDLEAHIRALNSLSISYEFARSIVDDYRELRALHPMIQRLKADYSKVLDSILGVK